MDTAEAIRRRNEFKNYQYHAELQEAHQRSEEKKQEHMTDTDEDYEGWFHDYAKGGKLTPAQFDPSLMTAENRVCARASGTKEFPFHRAMHDMAPGNSTEYFKWLDIENRGFITLNRYGDAFYPLEEDKATHSTWQPTLNDDGYMPGSLPALFHEPRADRFIPSSGNAGPDNKARYGDYGERDYGQAEYIAPDGGAQKVYRSEPDVNKPAAPAIPSMFQVQ